MDANPETVAKDGEGSPVAEKASASRRSFGSILLRKGCRVPYWCRFHWAGRQIWRTGGMKRADAAAKLAKAHALLSGGSKLEDVLTWIFGDDAVGGATWREAAESYLSAAALTHRATTHRADTVRIKRILRLGEGWTGKKLAAISTADLLRFREARLKVVGPATVNREISSVSVVFAFAVGHGLIAENPARRIRPLNEAEKRKETYAPTPEEVDALLSAAPERFRVYLIAAADLGARPAELRRARWENVDLEGRTLTIPAEDSKTYTARVLFLTDRLAAALAAMKTRAISGRVFDGLNDKRLYGDFRKAKDGAAKALPSGRWRDVTPRCLRKAFGTDHANAGTPSFELQGMMGHASIKTTEKHYITRRAQVAGAAHAARLEAYRNGGKDVPKVAAGGANP